MKATRRKLIVTFVAAMGGIIAGTARAQWVVFDPANWAQAYATVVQLIKEYNEIVAMVRQGERMYRSVTGIRTVGGLFMAMNDRLLYNQLPPEARDIVDFTGTQIARFTDLSRRFEEAQRNTTRLTERSFKDSNSQGAIAWRDAVKRISAKYAVSTVAYDTASSRTPRIEILIEAIRSSADPKAIQDLNARIAGEQALLLNDLIKLQAGQMVYQAQKEQEQQRQSDVITGMGSLGIPKVDYPKFGSAEQ